MAEIVNDIVGSISSFAESSPVIFYGVLAILAFLFYRRPKFFLIVISIAILVAGVAYIIMDMASSGMSKKQHMIRQDAPSENVCRLPRVDL